MADFSNMGTNVKYRIDGDLSKGQGKLVIEIDLSKKGNLSASGKNETISTTHGNQPIPGTAGWKFQVLAYKPNPKYQPE